MATTSDFGTGFTPDILPEKGVGWVWVALDEMPTWFFLMAGVKPITGPIQAVTNKLEQSQNLSVVLADKLNELYIISFPHLPYTATGTA